MSVLQMSNNWSAGNLQLTARQVPKMRKRPVLSGLYSDKLLCSIANCAMTSPAAIRIPEME